MKPREVHEEFSQISPFEHVSVDMLMDEYLALEALASSGAIRSYRYNMLLRANIAAEISLHPGASQLHKAFSSKMVNSLLLEKERNGNFTIADEFAEPLRAHLPLYDALPHPDQLPQSLARSLFRLIDSYPANAAAHSNARGYACEVGTSLIANGSERYGLKAYPSFIRQDRGKISGMNKSFDVMVESDGSTIQSGRYPVQVKSSMILLRTQYDPMITKINFDSLVGLKLADLRGSMGRVMLDSLVTDETTQQLTLHTPDVLSERLLEKLDATGPLDQEMLLTPIPIKEPK